ncbi:site-specific DNA-methyltransferase [Natrinema thermotolerans]|uniref:Type II methyltransferase n=1 Tax=Natrinema thermotolerans TaxID=121872 RepID=A0AAF0T153_9EURY|nr:site-specific DNA-methyltransferase [Natrinema thermotolerans]QCC60610.1 site-specific DNA-methyltransferase [Natrinema thermotolerans]QCC61496.1 site-specific DNA-methyltransferase [Natrinema thermotolerans]WMT07653.1 site-specific DNA-methyltransferase [Natrinema thermotolerans]WMT08285.1 site-specific DNA-methyltransferase [Natrinema thermotolerans]
METTHRVFVGDARDLSAVDDASVELVVTSPPYPMIEMWDDLFTDLDPAVGDALDAGDGRAAFEAMHAQLDRVWDELERVLVDGGIACINVGDATRSVDDSFRVYPNHARVLSAFEERGFDPLPDVLWRKPANSAAKFMGSGMIPPNAYVTLEHEYVLVFRKGGERRSFEPGADRRYEAAYFWEERNRWFSDVWTEVTGELQALEDDELRERSAAYPLEIPYRLICMYSAYEDTVLDPFWGTGTTTLAAMCAGRNSVGVELESAFLETFDDRLGEVPALSRSVGRTRLERHREFVERRREAGESLEYEADRYETPVVTAMEREIRLWEVSEVVDTDDGYRAEHAPLSLE